MNEADGISTEVQRMFEEARAVMTDEVIEEMPLSRVGTDSTAVAALSALT
ncbi:hypothetical protein [Streptomyces netropsis]|uniref:Uncharacterized protein n=1 Tax=Streptomyces netropsis TaxID=55404 RepID=A0A7W7L6P9_STRNE|nr:hypothetical protein [Streptomyces netropsis]MBB4884637.1 hypothetical protein [Streptomyces netropsis]